jgi:DNA-binding XRE family transcriptional regulator
MSKTKNSHSYPNALRQYRKYFDLSRGEVACLIGLKRAKTLSKWEKGVVMPDTINFLRLCHLYSVKPIDLYGGLMEKIAIDLKNRMVTNLPTIEY